MRFILEVFVAPIAIVFGALLTALGVGLYLATEAPTALIPAYFGGVLIVLGIVARAGDEKVRKHTMHLAAMVGLLGCVIPAFRVVKALAEGTEFNRAMGGQLAMAVLCGIFVALCVKSFIDIRRARKQEELSQGPPA
jgi:hypothetical protein